jgi:hypothetical protein
VIPARGCVIVRPVQTGETLGNSSIIIPEPYREQMASHQMIVQSVGEPEICEDPEECGQMHSSEGLDRDKLKALGWPWLHPTDKRIKPDAWILVRNRSLVEISAEDKFYSVKTSDVLGVFSESV